MDLDGDLAGELGLGLHQGAFGDLDILLVDQDGEDDLALSHPGASADGLAEAMAHAGADTVSARALGELVLPEDVEGINADLEEKAFFLELLGQLFGDGDP